MQRVSTESLWLLLYIVSGVVGGKTAEQPLVMYMRRAAATRRRRRRRVLVLYFTAAVEYDPASVQE